MKRLVTNTLCGFILVLGLGLDLGALRPAMAQEPVPISRLVLVSFDYPPYMEALPGQPPSGLVVELVNTIFSRMGQPIELQFYPLARSLSLIDTPRADGFFTAKKNPEREEKYLFPREPLLTQDFVIFVRAGSAMVFNGGVSELAEVRLGVVNRVSYGAIFDAAAGRGIFHRLEVAQTYEANFRKLLAGRMDALVSSRVMGAATLKRLNAQDKVKVVGPPIETTQSYLMFNRQTVAPAVATEFDQTLSAMRRDGTLRKIRDKYMR